MTEQQHPPRPGEPVRATRYYTPVPDERRAGEEKDGEGRARGRRRNKETE